MDVNTLLDQARDTMTVKRVFGEAIEKDGLTMIPVANVMGGAGAGSGSGPEHEAGGNGEVSGHGAGSGAGLGYGVNATPAGMYVIKGESVTWQPALNLNRVILGGQIVAVVLIITIGAIIRAARNHDD